MSEEIKEIIKPVDRAKEFGKLRTIKKADKVMSTGYDSVDEFMQLAKKYLMVVTGYPGEGKSEFVDCFLLNCTILHGWKTLFYSPENDPTEEHIAKLSEKLIGKNINTFKQKEIDESLAYMERFFTWICPKKDFGLKNIMRLAKKELDENGFDVLVLDPWNSISHEKQGKARDEYLEFALTKLLRFCKKNDILLIIVAHPKTPQRDKKGNYPDADLYSISDGAMWRNKIDIGVVVSRPDKSKHAMEVAFQKIKFKWMGHVGSVMLDYDYSSGRLKDQHKKEFELPTMEPPPAF